jgi:hypothetical protein
MAESWHGRVPSKPVEGAGDLRPLRARFEGELITPDDPGHDQARRVWNGLIDRHPALIARCTGQADVVEALRFARDRDLLVAVPGRRTA